MSLPKIKWLLQDSTIEAPSKGTGRSAGFDIRAAVDTVVASGTTELINTGVKYQLPAGYYFEMYQRSGKSLAYPNYLGNCVGILDNDYRGEIKIIFVNHTQADVLIKAGSAVAQLILKKEIACDTEIVDSVDTTERGEGGFSSTGD